MRRFKVEELHGADPLLLGRVTYQIRAGVLAVEPSDEPLVAPSANSYPRRVNHIGQAVR
jgi:hypothetical protein